MYLFARVHRLWHFWGAWKKYGPRNSYSIYGPMIYTAVFLMLLMRANLLRGQLGSGWALEIETFLGPLKWHQAVRRVPFGAQKRAPRLTHALRCCDYPRPVCRCMCSLRVETFTFWNCCVLWHFTLCDVYVMKLLYYKTLTLWNFCWEILLHNVLLLLQCSVATCTHTTWFYCPLANCSTKTWPIPFLVLIT